MAAARNVQISCGSTMIDGFAFCIGVEALTMSSGIKSDSGGVIHPVTYLIKEAIFRAPYILGRVGRFSLDICPLSQLIDMYHSYEATLRHDKVYALLGMSSDDLDTADLSPNYEVPWKELLARLIKFLLGEHVSVNSWNHREIAVINCRGCVLGRVAVEWSGWGGGVMGSICFESTSKHLGRNEAYDWTLLVSANPRIAVQNGDLVCLLKGASKPTIIRPYRDHFAVIVTAASLPEATKLEAQSMIDFPHDFLLVWNWEAYQVKLQDGGKSQTINEIIGHELPIKESEDSFSEVTRLWNVVRILQDSNKCEGTEQRMQEVIDKYEKAFGKEDLHTLAAMETLAITYQKTDRWDEGEKLFLRVIQTKKQVLGEEHPDTLSSMGSLALAYRAKRQSAESEKLEMMKQLLELKRGQITEGVIIQIAKSVDDDVVALLFERIGGEIQITEGIAGAASDNAKDGEKITRLLLDREWDKIQITEGAVVKFVARFDKQLIGLLLDKLGDRFQITEKVVMAAANNYSSAEEVMRLLLDTRGNEIQITEGVLQTAAKNWKDGAKIIRLLLDRKGGKIQITEGIFEAGAGNKEMIRLLIDNRWDEIQITERAVFKFVLRSDKQLIELLLNRVGDKIHITEEVVKAAAMNGEEALEFLLDRRGKEIQITEGVTEVAAWNKEGVMKLLLDQRGEEVQITEGVVKAAAGNSIDGEKIMELLLDRRGNEIRITEGIVQLAARNWGVGEKIMRLLLDRRENEVQITEEVVQMAAENERDGENIMRLLLDKKGKEIRITEGVIEAAASNEMEGEKIIGRLLDSKEVETQITEGVVNAVTERFGTRKEVMRLLHDRKKRDLDYRENS